MDGWMDGLGNDVDGMSCFILFCYATTPVLELGFQRKDDTKT